MMKFFGNKDVDAKTSTGRLMTAKFIALFAFVFVLVFFMTEVMAMGMYGLPYLSTEIARQMGVQQQADWVIGSILWWFPTLFLTIILALVHFYVIRYVIMRVWRWMVSVMKKTVHDCRMR